MIAQPSPEFQTLWIGEFGITQVVGWSFQFVPKIYGLNRPVLSWVFFGAGGPNLSLKAYGLENPIFFKRNMKAFHPTVF